jgi:hypothetical protein
MKMQDIGYDLFGTCQKRNKSYLAVGKTKNCLTEEFFLSRSFGSFRAMRKEQ